jgi:hypothetical protein
MAAIDKASRLAAEAEQRAKEKAAKAKRLDPPFPFKVRPFDPRFFGLR